jgi:hypothetical protein
MKKTKHPIQLPDSLISGWLEDTDTRLSVQFQEAAEWGANSELEACCQWLLDFFVTLSEAKVKLYERDGASVAKNLKKVRRPSANANALEVLDRISADIGIRDAAILRNAIEGEGVDD